MHPDVITVDDLIGKQYQDGAIGPNSYDCYTLAQEIFYRLNWDLDIPSSVLYNFGSAGWSFLRGNCDKWKILEDQQQFLLGDLVLIRGSSDDIASDGRHFARHLAVFIKEDFLIHCTRKNGVCLARWKHLEPFSIFRLRYIGNFTNGIG